MKDYPFALLFFDVRGYRKNIVRVPIFVVVCFKIPDLTTVSHFDNTAVEFSDGN